MEQYSGTKFNDGGPSQQVSNDHWVHILTPSASQIHIEDIRTSLCRQARFMGHTKHTVPYNVGHHSLFVSKMMENDGYDLPTVRAAFAHDWAEFVMGDLSSPMKRAMEMMVGKPVFKNSWGAIEEGLDMAIAERFQLIYPRPDEIKLYDYIALATERRDLLLCSLDWGLLPNPRDDFHLTPWTEAYTRRRFKQRFIELFSGELWEETK